MNKVNYSKELEKKIEKFQKEDRRPRLLLHACCAPCSSYCLEYLREFFDITVFYYNPNITEEAEYRKRVEEEKRLIAELNHQVESGMFEASGTVSNTPATTNAKKSQESAEDIPMHSTSAAGRIEILEGRYDPERFLAVSKGLELCPEGGERCAACFRLRLEESARICQEGGYDFFTTTLTISPLKDADRLNTIGQEMAAKYDTVFLPSDFKKKNGYKRSIELSHKFGLYRQDYCGCGFSKAERERQKR